MSSKRRLLITGITSVMLGWLYYVIFHFSAQDSVQSSSLSQLISERCVRFFGSLSRAQWSDATLRGLVEYFEHPIRKLAHFMEYGCMGILVYTLWSQWLSQGKKLRFLTVAWVFLSAASDEFHQYFVPGRYASVADVLLDTCGGTFGMFLCICALALYRRHRTAKSRKKAKNHKAAKIHRTDV